MQKNKQRKATFKHSAHLMVRALSNYSLNNLASGENINQAGNRSNSAENVRKDLAKALEMNSLKALLLHATATKDSDKMLTGQYESTYNKMASSVDRSFLHKLFYKCANNPVIYMGMFGILLAVIIIIINGVTSHFGYHQSDDNGIPPTDSQNHYNIALQTSRILNSIIDFFGILFIPFVAIVSVALSRFPLSKASKARREDLGRLGETLNKHQNKLLSSVIIHQEINVKNTKSGRSEISEFLEICESIIGKKYDMRGEVREILEKNQTKYRRSPRFFVNNGKEKQDYEKKYRRLVLAKLINLHEPYKAYKLRYLFTVLFDDFTVTSQQGLLNFFKRINFSSDPHEFINNAKIVKKTIKEVSQLFQQFKIQEGNVKENIEDELRFYKAQSFDYYEKEYNCLLMLMKIMRSPEIHEEKKEESSEDYENATDSDAPRSIESLIENIRQIALLVNNDFRKIEKLYQDEYIDSDITRDFIEIYLNEGTINEKIESLMERKKFALSLNIDNNLSDSFVINLYRLNTLLTKKRKDNIGNNINALKDKNDPDNADNFRIYQLHVDNLEELLATITKSQSQGTLEDLLDKIEKAPEDKINRAIKEMSKSLLTAVILGENFSNLDENILDIINSLTNVFLENHNDNCYFDNEDSISISMVT